LEGSLELEGFIDLKLLNCSSNDIASLAIVDSYNLEILLCHYNQLTELNVEACSVLKRLACFDNLLTNLDLTNNEELEFLVMSQNNFSERDLSFLSHLEKLSNLELGNSSEGLIIKNIYNRFTGSLQHLENMSNLEALEINNLDIDSGLEYLPVNIEEFYCCSYERKNSKVKVIERELKKHGKPDFVSENLYNFASLLKN
jgi:hypothetical protein